MTSRRNVTYALFGLGAGLIALGAYAMPRHHAAPPAPPPIVPIPIHVEPPPVPAPVVKTERPPRVEVVFALDTTGSMSGLIDGAKRKIWSIASYIAQAQPKPEVRIGLVGYRDLGDDYVTRFYDLTDDLDGVFQHLSSFQAAGGGDTPEHVAKALYDAVERTHWTSDADANGQKVVRLIYLVGDAPPHTDYQDGYNYRELARRAGAKNIHVNTILCGHDEDARLAWNDIARLGHGEYASIAQNGGIAVIATPYDDRLAEMNRRLTGTTLAWGSEGRRMEVRSKVTHAAAAPAAVAADRAGYAGLNGLAVSGDGDLLSDLKSGKAKLGAISAAELPSELRGLSEKEAAAYIAKKGAERAAVLGEINALAHERNEYLKRQETSAASPKRPAGFDDEVRRSLKKEAGSLLTF